MDPGEEVDPGEEMDLGGGGEEADPGEDSIYVVVLYIMIADRKVGDPAPTLETTKNRIWIRPSIYFFFTLF